MIKPGKLGGAALATVVRLSLKPLLRAVTLQQLLDVPLLVDQRSVRNGRRREAVLRQCLLIYEGEVITFLPFKVVEFSLALHILPKLGEPDAILLVVDVHLHLGDLLLGIGSSVRAGHLLRV